eukprot:gene19845-25794_t
MSNAMSPPHPVYSDFSHLASHPNADISSLTFAVGLREEDAEAMVAKILPMTKIIPGEVKPRLIRKKKIDIPIDDSAVCLREDCTARREYYAEIQSANAGLRKELRDLEVKVSNSKNRMTLTEKSIQLQEEKNEMFRGLIEETQGKTLLLEDQIKETSSGNQYIKQHLDMIQKDIEDIKKRAKDTKDRLTEVLNNKNGPSVVFSTKKVITAFNEIKDVSQLSDNISESDSDNE